MKRTKAWKKIISGVLAAVMLAGSLPDMQAQAVGNDAESAGLSTDETAVYMEEPYVTDGTEAALNDSTAENSSTDGYDDPSTGETVTEEGLTEESVGGQEGPAEESGSEEGDSKAVSVASNYQYVIFPDSRERVSINVPGTDGITLVENVAAGSVYRVNVAQVQEFVFEASVPAGFGLEIPESLSEILAEKQGRVFGQGSWIYRYGMTLSGLSTTQREPLAVRLNVVQNSVPVKVSGQAVITGIDEDGTAQLGSLVSIEVTQPGCALAILTKDEKGNAVYTAMELDYDNKYVFAVEEAAEFFVVDPEQADHPVVLSAGGTAKIAGAAGIKLNSLTSSAQGYREVVLNFTAVKNGNDGTETESVFYEVKVNAMVQEGMTLPAGSSPEPRYYYIPKVMGSNTQSKSILVNDGDLSQPTECNYEFSVRMVHISKSADVPDEDAFVEEPLEVVLSGNTITKTFATKNLYYEDKLGFTKKKTTVFSGQGDVLAGVVKYSKKASYLHDLMAVAYDSKGMIYSGITCTFKNDNDELYVSVSSYVPAGKYKVVVYAGIGEELDPDSPQSGTMYQANTSFDLTVQAGIHNIDTEKITGRVGVNRKNISFSAVPVGYDNHGAKSKSQKFTYEIKSAVPSDSGYVVTDPAEKVLENVSVNKSGKVTVKKGFYVDPDSSKNWIAVVIKAADFEGNETKATAYVQVVSDVLVPKEIYLVDSQGNRLGTKISAAVADGARVVVLDENGNNINQYVTLTPNSSKADIYVSQNTSGSATLVVNKITSVTVKATSRDGGNKSKSVKFTITKPKFKGTYYNIDSITSDGFDAFRIDTYDGYMNYSAPRGAVIKMRVGAYIDGMAYYKTGWIDWGYKVEGGKIKVDGDYWLLTPTKKKVKVLYWDKEHPSKRWYVTLTNDNWETKYDSAPKAKLIAGKAYDNAYAGINDTEYHAENDQYELPYQRLTYQYDVGSYDTIAIAAITKNAPSLYWENYDPEHRTFDLVITSRILKAGSYKYKVAFYKDGVMTCRPSTVTVKVNKASKVKVTSSYTLNTTKQSGIELKCSTKDFTPDFDTNLLNANVGGRANDFNKYFELVYDEDEDTGIKDKNTIIIRFKDTVTEEEIAALKGTSITGYVKYSYVYGYSAIKNVTSKVTIKIK